MTAHRKKDLSPSLDSWSFLNFQELFFANIRASSSVLNSIIDRQFTLVLVRLDGSSNDSSDELSKQESGDRFAIKSYD